MGAVVAHVQIHIIGQAERGCNLRIDLRVEDIEAMAIRVEELGGLIVIPPEEVVPGSKICLFTEPSSVTLALME